MASDTNCRCGRCRTRGLMGPVILIVVGAYFLFSQYVHHLEWVDLVAMILIAIGAVKVLGALVPSEGHGGA